MLYFKKRWKGRNILFIYERRHQLSSLHNKLNRICDPQRHIKAYGRGSKNTRGKFKLINRKYTDNAMAKIEKVKQTNNSTQDKT